MKVVDERLRQNRPSSLHVSKTLFRRPKIIRPARGGGPGKSEMAGATGWGRGKSDMACRMEHGEGGVRAQPTGVRANWQRLATVGKGGPGR